MPEQPGAGRLDAETLAAYVDGLLPPEERAKVEAEIAADPETYEWVVTTVNAVEDTSIVPAVSAAGVEIPARPADGEAGPGGPAERGGGDAARGRVLPFFRRRSFAGGAGVLVAAAAAMLLVVQMEPDWWQRLRGPQVDPRIAKLVEAVGEERYIEARLTGGFKYGPLRQVMRGPAESTEQNVSLLTVASALQREARGTKRPEVLHAAGVAGVLIGGTAVDEAVDVLTEAAELVRDGRVLSDLGAAYLESARQRGDRDRLEASLRASEEALRREPQLLEAAFNRALALEELGELGRAESAWQALVDAGGSVDWSREAARHLADVRHRLGDRPRGVER
jgi:hypothetical protein